MRAVVWLFVLCDAFLLRTPKATPASTLSTFAAAFRQCAVASQLEVVTMRTAKARNGGVHVSADAVCRNGLHLRSNGSGITMFRACEQCAASLTTSLLDQ